MNFAIRRTLLVVLFVLLSIRGAALGAEPAEHPPIPLRFALKQPGYVTLVVEDAATGMRVRNLVSEAHFEAGESVAWWDGLDDLGRDPSAASHFSYSIPGRLISPGRYRVRGLVREDVNLRYQMSAYNSSTVGWQTKDRASEWLANHTPPAAVLFVPPGAAPDRAGHPTPDGQILAGSFVSEGGSGLAWLNAHDGRKIHGQLWIGGVWTGATTLARDEGEHAVPGIYAYAGCAWVGDKYNDFHTELRLFALTKPDAKIKGPRDGRFGTGEDVPLLKPTYKLPAGLEVHEHENITPLGGLAVNNGIVVASVTPINQLLFVDGAGHTALATATLNKPRGLAFDRQGRLLAVSDRRVVRMAMPALAKDPPTTQPVALSEPQVLIASGLDDPQQLALDRAGNIYVSDRGDSHQVKIFSADGNFLRAIGNPGKPTVGPYDPDHMNNPYGISIDGKGRLWVAEQDKTPKRLSVWSSDGKLLKAFYGPPQYGGGGEMDLLDPSRFFYADDGGMELRIDWASRTSVPVALYYRRDADPAAESMPGHNAGRPPQTPIHVNGRTYLVDCYNTSPVAGIASSTIWLLEQGVARRVAIIGRANDWPALNPTAAFSIRWTGMLNPPADGEYTFTAQVDDGVRLWIDGNQLIDHWRLNGGPPVPVGKAILHANKPVSLKMEYFQKGGNATATLLWEAEGMSRRVIPADRLSPTDGNAQGLTAQYFSDCNLARPLLTRIDPKIQFHWGSAGFKVGPPSPFQNRMPAGINLEKEHVTFAWSDLNGDGEMQPEEITCIVGDPIGVTFMPDLTAITAGGLALKPTAFTAAGAPIYDAAKAQLIMPDCQRPTSSGGGQAILDRAGRIVLTVAPKPFAPQSIGGGTVGKATWSYPSLWPGLHASHSAPLPDHPGELIGTTRLLGQTITPKGSDAGEILAINGNKGNVYLFTTDGLFVATLYKDSRTSSWDFPDATPGMLTNDASLHEENFFPTISQSADGSIYLSAMNAAIVKVEGLEKVRRLADWEIDVTADQLGAARDYFVQAEQRRQSEKTVGPRKLAVQIRSQPPVVDGILDDWTKAQWATIDVRDAQVGDWGKRKVETRAAVCVAGDRLYAAFETDDANLLANAGGSLPTLFKSGGALDLMIGVNPNADPNRRAPVAGDVRLLVTRVAGKTTAVLYRAVAAGSTTEPVPFSSPLRTIRFDRVDDVSEKMTLAMHVTHDIKVKKDAAGYEFSIPLSVLGLHPEPGQSIRADIGVLRGNGFHTFQRSYWSNKAAGIVSDEPSEAELTPQLWGTWMFVAGK